MLRTAFRTLGECGFLRFVQVYFNYLLGTVATDDGRSADVEVVLTVLSFEVYAGGELKPCNYNAK